MPIIMLGRVDFPILDICSAPEQPVSVEGPGLVCRCWFGAPDERFVVSCCGTLGHAEALSRLRSLGAD